ncbi:MAG: ankyrin repeat domain-containing protein [Gammaproteobacteria bacterium]|nr:ankyrin repeat domain-containing protein [Gammaproteobacteria bacterium]
MRWLIIITTLALTSTASFAELSTNTFDPSLPKRCKKLCDKSMRYDNSPLEFTRMMQREGINIYSPSHNSTPLISAIIRGDTSGVKFLLEQRADPNLANKRGCSPLHFAARSNRSTLIELLLRYGAKPNVGANTQCGTALHAPQINVQSAEQLISAGANVRLTDKVGNTPAHTTLYADVLQTFLDNGAAVNQVNTLGNTPLHAVFDNNYAQFAYGKDEKALAKSAGIMRSEMIIQLINNRANANLKNNAGSNAYNIGFEKNALRDLTADARDLLTRKTRTHEQNAIVEAPYTVFECEKIRTFSSSYRRSVTKGILMAAGRRSTDEDKRYEADYALLHKSWKLNHTQWENRTCYAVIDANFYDGYQYGKLSCNIPRFNWEKLERRPWGVTRYGTAVVCEPVF